MIFKFLQINVGRSKDAHALLDAFSRQVETSIILISEPNKKISKDRGYITDQEIDSALVLIDKNIRVSRIISKKGYAGVVTENILMLSVYISPNVEEEVAVEILENIRLDIRGWRGHVVIGGDFNAKAREWGSARGNRRGDILLEWMAEQNLHVLNRGNTPTFVRGEQTSFIDLTLCSAHTLQNIVDWKVLDNELSISLHRYITYDLDTSTIQEINHQQECNTGWIFKTGDAENLQRRFTHLCSITQVRDATHLQELLIKACKETLSKKSQRKKTHKQVYWWNGEINGLKENCNRKWRITTRLNRRNITEVRKEEARVEFKLAKQALSLAIKKSKEECWNQLCEEIERDPWGLGYKIATKRIQARPPNLTAELEKKILLTLFPQVEETLWTPTILSESDIQYIHMDELAEALLAMKSKKAPGPDCVTTEMLKAMGLSNPQVLLDVYNNILKTGIFPEVWKIARVVLVPKPGKPEFIPSSYRPLCLLNTSGKLFESILARRIYTELSDEGLSDCQYGFRPKRSTVHAIRKVYDSVDSERKRTRWTRKLCLLITLDVRNAFGTAPWGFIVQAMRNKRIPEYLVRLIESYFQNRRLITPNGEEMKMSAGVPTGSVVGPVLWNVFYDGVLRLEMPENVELVGYADDLAIIIKAKNAVGLETLANEALSKVGRWLVDHGLKMAPEKTEAVLLIGRKRCGPVRIMLEENEIILSNQVRYLGILLDRRLSFGPHVEYVAVKATNRANALVKLMPRQRGPSFAKRKLMYRVVESTILYAAPVWREAGHVKSYMNRLQRVQRNMLLRITSAYRTASTAALQVVAGMVPIGLMLEERTITFGLGKEQQVEQREITIGKWNERWGEETTGSWTRKLIPNLTIWVTKKKSSNVDFHLTQVLTGHGCFNAYLHRFKKRDSPACRYCIMEDTAEHTLFECVRWQQMRDELNSRIGEEFTTESMVKVMLRSEIDWSVVKRYVGNIMRRKEEDERIEENELESGIANPDRGGRH